MERLPGGCYDVLIIGAGVQGSSTAYYLKKKLGVNNVLLLEQFSTPSTRGSSSGCSRITRRAYGYPFYVKMMEEAFPMWSDLEKESQKRLYIKTGILVFGSSSDSRMKDYKDSLNSSNIKYETLPGTRVSKTYSKQLSLPDNFTSILEEDGGILLAPQAIQAFQKLFIAAGGELKTEHQVTEIVPGEEVVVRTNGGSFKTKRLIITTGPWTNILLQPLGIQLVAKVFRPEVLYWRAKNPDDFSCKNFHTFLGFIETEEGMESYFYGIPIHEYPGLVKICYHCGHEADPDLRDSSLTFTSVNITSKFVSRFIKNVDDSPSIAEPCLYLETSDGHPFLDQHPQHSNIVIGAGFSGHGFKLAPVIGKILSELSLGLHPSYDLSPFKIGRFPVTVHSKI